MGAKEFCSQDLKVEPEALEFRAGHRWGLIIWLWIPMGLLLQVGVAKSGFLSSHKSSHIHKIPINLLAFQHPIS